VQIHIATSSNGLLGHRQGAQRRRLPFKGRRWFRPPTSRFQRSY